MQAQDVGLTLEIPWAIVVAKRLPRLPAEFQSMPVLRGNGGGKPGLFLDGRGWSWDRPVELVRGETQGAESACGLVVTSLGSSNSQRGRFSTVRHPRVVT